MITAHLLETQVAQARLGADTVSPAEAALVLETNLDDVTPETLGYLIDRLIDEGAADAWITPIVMKKTRPAHQLSVLTSPKLAPALRRIISAETGTLGIRQTQAEKYPLSRSVDVVDLLGHEVRIKIGPHGAKPEHDDLVSVARATGQPLRSLAMQALALWRDISHG